jgi:alkylated DNA repair dioxygenase AlkB
MSLIESGAIWIENDFLPDSAALYDRLVSAITWDERIISRKVASFGAPYNYSGTSWSAAPFPDSLLTVLERVAARLGYRPDNCLANYYPDGRSTMGFHRDAVSDLAPGTGIAVLSLGACRTLSFRSEADKRRIEQYRLPSGSLLYMSPEMQADWKHAIQATDTDIGGRISLTFRRMREASP